MKKQHILLPLIIILITLFALYLFPAESLPGRFEKATVIRIVDGDTVVVDLSGKEERVRMIGVDTPESVKPRVAPQPFSKEASTFTKQSLLGREIYLEKDISERDRFDRLLRYIWLELPEKDRPTTDEIRTLCFSGILIDGGYGRSVEFKPDIKYLDMLEMFEAKAKQESRGLWALEAEKGEIKGNKKSKIYHLPTDKSYDKVSERNAVYFQTEKEAIAAGYRRTKTQ